MLRRFSTSGSAQAISRASRMAARPSMAVSARGRAGSAKSSRASADLAAEAVEPNPVESPKLEPKRATISLNSVKTTFAPNSEPRLAPEGRTTSETGAGPRVVPELYTSASTTSTAETTDPNEVVSSLSALEESDPHSEDWTRSFQGLGSRPFDRAAIDLLMAPVVPSDVEITPDGLLYLPEIKYRRILNRAFGPGGWGIAPRTKTLVTKRQVTREYGLVCLGRLVSVSRGEMDFFSAEGITTAMEGCKSNALMRCCKDLGIASELWDPAFIREFKKENCDTKYHEKKRRYVWKRKDRQWEYPYN